MSVFCHGGGLMRLVMWMNTVTVEQSGRPGPLATGWPGWVSLEGEGALAQSPGLAAVSGSGLGLPEHSGPDTATGFPL